MKQKYLKILSLLMLIMTIGFSIAVFMGHSDATSTAAICASASLVNYGASKRVK